MRSFLTRSLRKSLNDYFVQRLAKVMVIGVVRLARRLAYFATTRDRRPAFVWSKLSEAPGFSKRTVLLAPEEMVIGTPDFRGFGADKAAESFRSGSFEFPEIAQYEFEHCIVLGGFEAFLRGDRAIHHDLFDPANHVTPADNLGLISRRGEGLHVNKPLGHVRKVETAINLIGQCTDNYAHWLTEILPKLAILNENETTDGAPLLVDASLPSNILSSIGLLDQSQRPVIQLAKWDPIEVDRLVTITIPGYERYVPGGLWAREPPSYFNVFSASALKSLRESMLSRTAANHTTKKKIYLARGNATYNSRRLVNWAKIEEVASLNDFAVFNPSDLSFPDQIYHVSNARVIVAPVGAALANMIFAPPGCQVIALAPYYHQASYSYYANLASALGHHLTFVLGRQLSAAGYPMHRPYEINERLFEECLLTYD